MFHNHVPLNKQQHQHLKLKPQTSFAFAAGEQLLPIVATEAPHAAHEFVIAFPRESGGLPQVVTGLGGGRNVYVDDAGRWGASFVPAQLQTFPFLLAEHSAQTNVSDAQRGFTVHVVPDAPHFASGDGEPLLDDAGNPTPAMLEIQRSLGALQSVSERTQFLVQQIDDAGLLAEVVLPVRSSNGTTVRLSGLRAIDKARLDALSAEALERLRDSGAMALIEAHVVSLKNLEKGRLVGAAGSGAIDAKALFAGLTSDDASGSAKPLPDTAGLLAALSKTH